MTSKKTTMACLSQRYSKIIEANLEENIRGWQQAQDYIKESTAYNHGEAADFLYMPKFFTREAIDFLAQVGTTTFNILSKIIRAYRQEPTFRKSFAFPKDLEEWLILPSQFDCQLPLARVDLFFNEEDFTFTFCEFNADGASAMNKDREIYNALCTTPAFAKMRSDYDIQGFELFHSWVQAFADIYASSGAGPHNPLIAIVDFLESGTTEEFKVFRSAFAAAGYETVICEIRDLKRRNKGLYTPDGRRIDAIYRRAVTGEMYDKRAEIEDFLVAVRQQEVILIGPLATQVIHNKILFEVIQRQEILDCLTKEEQDFVKRHFPYTCKLQEGANLEQIVNDKDNWLIKPEDLYGSRGVYAGKDQDNTAWRHLIAQYANQDYLAQKYQKPYVTTNYDFNATPSIQSYNNITGLYLYNGTMAGIYSRAGQEGVISSLHGGRTMTSVLAAPLNTTLSAENKH